jgi:phosphoglycerol transferase MdoB-like AlkP superfamily enzyme
VGLQKRIADTFAYLRPLVVFAAAVLVALSLARVGLVLWQHDRVREVDMLGVVLVQGVRFDLIVVGLLTVIPTLLLWLFATSRSMARVGNRLLRGYLGAAFATVLFLELATPSFINQYDARPNAIFFEYLIYPKEVASTMLAGYGYQFFGAFVVIVLALVLLRRLLRPALRIPERAMHVAAALVVTPLLFALCLLAMRSTLDHRAVNPSMVARSRDPMVNDLAMNSTYSVLYALAELRNGPEGGFRYGTMPAAEATARVQAAMQVPTGTFVAGTVPTLHRQQATQSPPRPKNLVIVLEESLGAEFVGALGGRPLTPNLDALASQGWWFENLYATGTRSVRGLEALITGFTPTPAPSVVKLEKSQRDFFSIARVLKAAGYDTSFIYGGEGQFDNMRRFFMNNGFDSVVDEDDFVKPVFHGSWGVSDEDLLARADEEFSKPRTRPFFSLVFTTSNHSPYDYPAGRIEPYDADPRTVNNAVKYADYALGEFFARARASSYWDDTVFLVVADHNSRVFGAELIPIDHFHIPGLVMGGGVEPSVYNPVASQIDLPPTLLSMIGVSSVHPMIGHDLTRPELAEWPGRAIMQYEDTQAYLRGNEVAVLRRHLPAATFRYDGETTLVAEPHDPELEALALAHATWTSETYEHLSYRLPAGTASWSETSAPERPLADTDKELLAGRNGRSVSR